MRRTSKIIKEIERDALGYPALLDDTWPQDIAYSRRVVGAILTHLKSEDIPRLHWVGRFASIQDHLGAVPVAEAALSALQSAVLHTKDEEELLNGLLEGLQDNLWGLLSWLEFITHRSAAYVAISSAAAPGTRRVPEFSGYVTASNILCWLHRCLEYVEVEETFLKELSRLVLLVWTGSPRLGEKGLEAPQKYGFLTYMLSEMFSSCLNAPSTWLALRQHVNELDLRTSKRLSESFIGHVQKWEEMWRAGIELGLEAAQDGFAVLVMTAQELADASRCFSKILSRSAFSSIALRAALAHPASLSRRSGSNRAPPMAIRIVGDYLRRRRPISERVRTIPGLLEVGLLRVVVQSLLVNSAGEEDGCDGENGLFFLLSLCNCPPITDDLVKALAALPSNLVSAVTANPSARTIWSRFFRSLELFRKAYHPEPTPGSRTVCDNLEHDSTKRISTASGKEFQCSGCGTVVYCSEECQRKAWKSYHRAECNQARAYRIGCQLDGVWLSHQTRTALLMLSEFSLNRCLQALHRAGDESKQPERNQMFLVEVHSYPMRTLLLDVKSVLEMSLHGRPVFGDLRSQDMLRLGQENDSIEMVATMATLGAYYIATLSTFRVHRGTAVEDGNGQGDYSPALLNQYMKLLKRTSGPSGVYNLTLPPEYLSLNSRE